VTGLEETVFPHRRALLDDDELEEERRLFYVGVTRAMRHLSLTHAWSRTMWGQRVEAIASRFLQEVPSELITDISSTLPTRRSSFSSDDEGFVGRSTAFTEGRAFGTGAARRCARPARRNWGWRSEIVSSMIASDPAS